MLFNSFDFLIFFPIVSILYFIIPSVKWRNYFLLGASYYFYMNWEPSYALLLLTSTAITYASAIAMEKCKGTKKKQLWLVACITLNLLILLFFKYYYFIGENITAALTIFGVKMKLPDFGILLPVGISFYTFQALGYSIDVYRGTIKAEKSFLTYALFVSFFPQLVAGPIERSTNLLRQFYEKHRFRYNEAIIGLKTMLWGYFLKLVLADRCAIYVDEVYNHVSDHPGYSALIASILFCFQLYGDFAGYTYIAIGTARIMGFKLMDNFRRPYLFSTSIQDYWKRNHISLTSWFMDYIYYPMTERKNTLNWWCFSIFATFLISGFWHGAAWTFVLWGAIHGVLLIVEMRTSRLRKRWEKKHGLTKNMWYVWTERIFVFFILTLTLVFFRANSLSDSFVVFKQIFSVSDFTLSSGHLTLVYVLIGWLIMFIKEYRDEHGIDSSFYKKHPEASNVIWMSFILICILQLGVFDGGEFIYFQF